MAKQANSQVADDAFLNRDAAEGREIGGQVLERQRDQQHNDDVAERERRRAGLEEGSSDLVEHRLDVRSASAGRAALPNSVRRNGISRTKVKPSSTDEMTVAAIVAANNIEYGRNSDSSRAPPPPPPRSLARAARRQQRDRQDHLLGRRAAVQECAAIARLVLPQLRRIHEEAVARREQQPHTEALRGKTV